MTALQPLVDAQANVAAGTQVEVVSARKSTKLVLSINGLQADGANAFHTFTRTNGGPLQPSFEVVCRLAKALRCRRILKPDRLPTQAKLLRLQPRKQVAFQRNGGWRKFNHLSDASKSFLPDCCLTGNGDA